MTGRVLSRKRPDAHFDGKASEEATYLLVAFNQVFSDTGRWPPSDSVRLGRD